MTRVIGLTGKAGAGQHTVASRLITHGYRVLTFADALRVTARDVDPVVSHITEGHTGAGLIHLAEFVTGDNDTLNWVRRNVPEADRVINAMRGRGAHLDTMKCMVADAILDGDDVVIVDCDNVRELAFVKALDGVTVRVTLPDTVAPLRLDVDRVVVTDGSITELRDAADSIARRVAGLAAA